ncbi:RNA polymerase sigma factor [Novosphingobium resinovorum]|uniref:RNA polymerase sigma factor n=1 Tax=Novosphingobium resinovorum TaxID=158500 RepID=UPI002ED27C04|nr:RNA polymerase sigma factor [Novosphingobium resinovorum]
MKTNASALSLLILRERQTLLRVVERIVRNWAAAEDVTQTLWLKVQRVDDHPPILNKRAYLFRLATNLARDRLRADHRHDAVFEGGTVPEHVADDSPGADRAVLDREALDRLRDVLGELPARTREILYMRRFEELSSAQIGERLGISRQMVNRHIAQAMAHCLDRLDEDDDDGAADA